MEIIKKINTSAAIAIDSNGVECVVLGKGIGFPAVPYELTDLSKVERTFYDVNSKYFSLIDELPQPILLASSEIVEFAEIELDCELNSNLPFTLADHIHFAIERLKKGVDLTTPIAYDIAHLYAREYAVAKKALDILSECTGIFLPESETVTIAMHLINAESENGDIKDLIQILKITDQITSIIEKQLSIKLDTSSYNYNRFAMHIRYLIQRLKLSDNEVIKKDSMMLKSLAKDYPNIYNCALKIVSYLKSTWNWTCNDEETAFLMLHIYRVQYR
ncbi:MAG: PRD domain-containing protein [Erysipelotrichales bacterium]|nr:PRD domain-containing protein [Erysipelotrichales bacterium]